MLEFMKRASEAYYNGDPIISDAEYDALERIHGQIIAGSGDISHRFRMYSLQKHYEADGDYPLPIVNCLSSPKLDGAAVALLYINGELAHALTRGNGIKGRDITQRMIQLGIPTKVKVSYPVMQITGEVVASKDLENSRNYAAGALNLKSDEEFEQRIAEGKLAFVAYNVQVEENRWGFGNTETYYADLQLLEGLGFHSILGRPIWVSTSDEPVIAKYTPWEDLYPTDGTVYRINNNAVFNKHGFTDKFPKGAFAHKEAQDVYETTLLDVVWQTGKSGKVTPVAILEPVNIDGANVSRATLNNIAYIESLDLEIGCGVEIIRSGEIIPKIIGKL